MRRVVQDVLKQATLTQYDILYVYDQSRYLSEAERWAAFKRLVSDPNCPPSLYARLFPQMTDHALQNPAWPLYLIEGEFLSGLEPTFLATCLRHESTSHQLIEALRSHPVGWIASAAQYHVTVAGEASLGWGQELLTDFATRLWRDSALVWVMRAGALPSAINRRLPYPIKAQLLLPEGERPKVLEKIAGQRKTSLATVLAIAHMKSPNLALGDHVRWERRLALALNRNASSAKKKLQHDGHVWVRAAARGSEGIL